MILWKHLIHSWQAVPSVWKNRAAVRSASNKSHALLVSSGSLFIGPWKNKRKKKKKLSILTLSELPSHLQTPARAAPAASENFLRASLMAQW